MIRRSAPILFFVIGCNGILGLEESTLKHDGGVPDDSGAPRCGACPAEQATRCEGRAIATCTNENGCAVWSAPASCGDKRACLADHCADCAPLAQGTREFYVDAASDGTGTALCPFKTITLALQAAAKAPAGSPPIIHVAAGTYDAALGERFPLVARGVTIEGAGPGKTIVDGATLFNHESLGGAMPERRAMTLLVGDALKSTAISKMTIRPAQAQDATGIFCDAGNAAFTGKPRNAPNTFVEQVDASGYSYGMAVTTSSFGAVRLACNAKITGSTFHKSFFGIFSVGCIGQPMEATPALEVGNGTDDGANLFSDLRNAENHYATGITVWDCTSSFLVRKNRFEDSDNGIAIAYHGGNDAYLFAPEINGNTFARITRFGLDVGFSGTLAHLNGNKFSAISAGPGDLAPAAALRLEGPGPAPHFPRVLEARENLFVGNDIGILVNSSNPLTKHPTIADTDFGRPGSDGKNVFRCNSAPRGRSYKGGDVMLNFPASPEAPSFLLAGNFWDHPAPTVEKETAAADGIDVHLPGASIPIDVSGAQKSEETCPDDRTP